MIPERIDSPSRSGVSYVCSPLHRFHENNGHEYYLCTEYQNNLYVARRLLVKTSVFQKVGLQQFQNWRNRIMELVQRGLLPAILTPLDVCPDGSSIVWVADASEFPSPDDIKPLRVHHSTGRQYLDAAKLYLSGYAAAEWHGLMPTTLFFCPKSKVVLVDTSPPYSYDSNIYSPLLRSCPYEHRDFFGQLFQHRPAASEAYNKLLQYIAQLNAPAPSGTQPSVFGRRLFSQPVPRTQPQPIRPTGAAASPYAGVPTINVPRQAPTAPASTQPVPRQVPATPAASTSPQPVRTPVPPAPRPQSATPWPSSEYRLVAVPEIGGSCPAVHKATGKAVIIERHSVAEKELFSRMKSIRPHLSEHALPSAPGLCLLKDFKTHERSGSFLIVREAIDVTGWLPVGHPTLLALEQKDKLTIARNMAVIFHNIVSSEEKWLPTRIVEANMLVNPRDLSVCFADGYLLSTAHDAPLTCTLGYAAPEYLGKKAVADIPAVSYALAVWLYRLFIGGYPLEGRQTLAALKASGKSEAGMAGKLYGSDAVFCFHPANHRNSLDGLGGHYSGQQQRWDAAPESLRNLWLRTFVDHLHHKPGKRPEPYEWLVAINSLL